MENFRFSEKYFNSYKKCDKVIKLYRNFKSYMKNSKKNFHQDNVS